MINLLRNFAKRDSLKLFCDIDGTVNYHYKRIRKWTLPKWPGEKIDLRAFTREEILKDEVIPDSVNALKELSNYFDIYFLTARDFPNAYKITKEWLDTMGFLYDGIHIVSTPIEKVKFLKKHKSDLFIDDLQRGHQTSKVEYYDDVITQLIKSNIRFEIFSNNWDAIMVKYINWAKHINVNRIRC